MYSQSSLIMMRQVFHKNFSLLAHKASELNFFSDKFLSGNIFVHPESALRYSTATQYFDSAPSIELSQPSVSKSIFIRKLVFQEPKQSKLTIKCSPTDASNTLQPRVYVFYLSLFLFRLIWLNFSLWSTKQNIWVDNLYSKLLLLT